MVWLWLKNVKMIVSTIHDYDTNSLLLNHIKSLNKKIILILSAKSISDAESLYKQGAHYVIVPHVIGGNHTAMLIDSYEYDLEKYVKHRIDDYGILL